MGRSRPASRSIVSGRFRWSRHSLSDDLISKMDKDAGQSSRPGRRPIAPPRDEMEAVAAKQDVVKAQFHLGCQSAP